MGYTTFTGEFNLDQQLQMNHKNYLTALSGTRRMKRDPALLLKDPIAEAVGLTHGKEGQYFVSGTGMCGPDRDISVIDYNHPPFTQPGLWCKWVPNEDGTAIVWSGAEKFYDYIKWLEYIIRHFLIPWGYTLNGTVSFQGEERSDRGIIVAENNIITKKMLRGEDETDEYQGFYSR